MLKSWSLVLTALLLAQVSSFGEITTKEEAEAKLGELLEAVYQDNLKQKKEDEEDTNDDVSEQVEKLNTESWNAWLRVLEFAKERGDLATIAVVVDAELRLLISNLAWDRSYAEGFKEKAPITLQMKVWEEKLGEFQEAVKVLGLEKHLAKTE